MENHASIFSSIRHSLRTPLARAPIFAAFALVVYIISAAVLPVSSVSAADLTDAQRGAISQHCPTIKQSLRTLQRTDARTRSYLGSAYEDLLTHYITPLNLRLINSGQPNAALTNIHSEIIETKKAFISEYTTYSQALEDLIYADCQGNPDEFYQKLTDTRKKRGILSATTTTLRNLLSEHLTAVRRLKTNLGESANVTE